MRKLLHSKIQKKLLLIMLTCSILPLALLGIVIFRTTTNTIETNMENLYQVSIDELSLSMSLNIKSFLDLIQYNADTPEVQEALRTEATTDHQMEQIRDALKSTLDSTYMITRVNYPYYYLAISADGTIYTRHRCYTAGTEALLQQPWCKRLMESYKEQIWIGEGDTTIVPGDIDQIFVARNVSDDKETVGVLIYVINKRFLSHQLDSLNKEGLESLYVLDENDRCIAEGLDNSLSFATLQEMQPHWDNGEVVIDSVPYMVNISEISMDYVDTTWQVMSLTPLNLLYREANYVTLVTGTMILLLSLVCVILIVLMNHYYIEPILQVHAATREVQRGNLDVRVHQPRNDELGELTEGFDDMTQSLKAHIQTIQEEEAAKRRLELQVLQEQIRPHFISNTLNSLRIMADMRKATGISNAISSFIRLIDYYFRDTKQNSTVRDELTHLEEYVFLQNLRFQNRFEFYHEVDSDVLDYPMLKLTLQPLVENCIKHGFAQPDRQGRILIRGSTQGDRVVITVADDGAGMSPERLEEVFSPSYLLENSEQRIGLGNVQRRIQAHFGATYGLHAESRPGEGTIVTLELPLLQQEEQHEDSDR